MPQHDVDLMEFSKTIASGRKLKVVPEPERERYRQMSLTEFWADPDFGLNLREVSMGTRARQRGALSRWERFCGRPESIPFGDRFSGCVLGCVTDEYLTEFAATLVEAGGLAHATTKSTCGHLATLFNHAVNLKVIETAPKVLRWPRKTQTAEEDLTTIYQADGCGILETLERIHRALNGQQDLQDGFQFANSIGARPVDLFCLRWNQFSLDGDRPRVSFVARKTQKVQVVPLSPAVLRMLHRRKGDAEEDDLVFPTLTNPKHKESPEHSVNARRRKRAIKEAIVRAGLDEWIEKQFYRTVGDEPRAVTFRDLKIFSKPFQAARATCNERLERVQVGAGQFVLGHCATLNSRSYREPSGMVFDAVQRLPEPECWRLL